MVTMNWRKWLDGFALAGRGILLATREKRFWYGFIPSFLFFGLLMNLLAGGFSKFELMGTLGFPQNLQIIGNSFLAIFGIGQPFLDWLPIFAICILQGTLIGLIVLLWNKKRQQASDSTNAANLEKAGIITGLIALGAGCPTCGTTLLTPLLGAIFSTGGLAVTGTISTIVTVLAIIIAILSLKRLGEEAYVIIINEIYLAKHPPANPTKSPKSAKSSNPTKSSKSKQSTPKSTSHTNSKSKKTTSKKEHHEKSL